MKSNLFDFKTAEVTSIRQEIPGVNTYTMKLKEPIQLSTGQFIFVSVPIIGEFITYPTPLSDKNEILEITVTAGNEQGKSFIERTRLFDSLYLRGGYGKPFGIDKLFHKNVLLVSANTDICKMRPIFRDVVSNREHLGKIDFRYSAYSGKELIYRDQFAHWQAIDNVQMTVSLERPEAEWSGYRGDILALLSKISDDLRDWTAILSLERNLLSRTVAWLIANGLNDSNLFLFLDESIMCGIGKCCGCNIGSYLACQDGPVFCFSEIAEDITEKLFTPTIANG